MKHSIQFISTLLVFNLPIAAQAACDRYQNATLTLTLPSTITVPDSLPVGAEIIIREFSGTAPAFTAYCSSTLLTIIGRYQARVAGYPNIYQTEASGVGVRLRIRDASGLYPFFAMINQQVPYSGPYTSFTAAELRFHKVGPVTDQTVPAGNIWVRRWDNHPESFTLRLGNPVRFVSPAATCDLATGDVNRTITLDPVKVSTLQDATYANQRNFELTANCAHASSVTFRFSGTPAPGNDRLFANTGTAGGVALWLYSRIGGGIQNILADGTENTRTVPVSGGRAVLPLGAAYHQNGTVRQGTLIATTTVSITYN
ncbi:type 1 fimbria pilin [Pseudomonas sp. SJZ103]|uniref:fimbrial protein n=1 Tax=unclassified Pseudomonas TaxID=196821 RepID=UPI0011A41F53|nr:MULTISPECIES: fimbrial protein [unclassified Pseudomonas]NJJ57447.1 type 1 fimbrial protein [Pseudomonas sp. B14(2022)]TWC72640.1 type 1 fimbria pilin [Pseudomonas sp. SJZ103]TWC90996.1 type 1 fimbria pilin [Pseudomonas sp. SJZ094]